MNSIASTSIMSIDIGTKRIGLAIYKAFVVLPIKPIIRKNRLQASQEIKNIISDKNITKIIIGIPKNSSFKEEMQRRGQHFISLLNFEGTVEYIDEDMSSDEAKQRVRTCHISKKNGILDSISAQIILERYIAKNRTFI